MLATRAAAALALATLAPAASAQWIQVVTVPFCQGTPPPSFSPSDLSFNILVPFSVAGSPPRCIIDSDNATDSLYFEADAPSPTSVARYRCNTGTCTDCTLVKTLSSIGRVANPDCGNYFQLLTASGTLNDGLPNLALNRGSGTLASAFFTVFKSVHSSASPCGADIQRGDVFYLFEECTQVTAGGWLKTVFDPLVNIITTYACTSASCQTGCTKAIGLFKPAPPGQAACHSLTTLDRNYTTARVLKASSRYNNPAASDFEPPATWLASQTSGPAGSSPTGAQTGTPTGTTASDSSSPNTGLIVGATGGGVAIIIATIGAFLAVRRAHSQQGHRESSSEYPLTALGRSDSATVSMADSNGPRGNGSTVQAPSKAGSQAGSSNHPSVLAGQTAVSSSLQPTIGYSDEGARREPFLLVEPRHEAAQDYPIIEPPRRV
ncbi:hypothetical protein HK105_205201 [Polyrhizophydium stewartii]|uniref:Uncharacterized protein n=1 Tax=Polyrhizophydium stewartii TaxID=2732419 RepID=A0ABR4N736_9FUNG